MDEVRIEPAALKEADACRYLGIARTTLKGLVARKKIRRFPVGNRRYRYAVKELKRFMEANEGKRSV